jgi:[acyl-carrier-protein] S-malonyltransferase
MRVAFVFPGAGVPCCGAEARLWEERAGAFAPFLEEASSRAGVDFAAALADGRIDAIPDRERQHFTYAFGAAFCELLRACGLEPVATAGYSFGVYAALYGAGAISLSTGFDLLERAYEVMAAATAGLDCGMGIVVGLTAAEVRALLAGDGLEALVLANSNSETCHVLSGPAPALDAALAAASLRDAISAKRLPVAIPYHHPALLDRARRELLDVLGAARFLDPRCPVVSSIDQRPLRSPAELAGFVAANVATPISWARVVPALAALGAEAVVDCGPGISLAQNARFIDGAPPHVSVKNARGRLGL